MKAVFTAVLLAIAAPALATGYGYPYGNSGSTHHNTTYDYDWTYDNSVEDYSTKLSNETDVSNRNSNTGVVTGYNRSDNRSSAAGLGVGIGGDSSASARGGSARATGGETYGINAADVDGHNKQSQSQTQSNSNGATGSGNVTSIVVEGDVIPVQKKADVPAIAPNVNAPAPTAPCYVSFGGSGAYGGLVSIGGTGYVKDHGCALGEVARVAAFTGNQAVADEALGYMFALVKSEAGLDEKVETDVPAFVQDTAPQDDVLWYAK